MSDQLNLNPIIVRTFQTLRRTVMTEMWSFFSAFLRKHYDRLIDIWTIAFVFIFRFSST